MERTPVSFGPGVFYFTEVYVVNEKPFKIHEELLTQLEARGIIYNDSSSRSFAKKKLQRIG